MHSPALPMYRAATLASDYATANRRIAWWLLVCCAFVYALVVVGGITRLTGSGLSITEWQPLMGVLPPLDDAQWQAVFAKYQASPQFVQVNHQMELGEFKGIFWWEYVHRLLGRLVGVVFLLPYLWFLVRRRIPPGYALPLAGIFVLGGAQGALGWYMVQSGLVDDPRVSQFRLTAHLGLAVLIFGAMLWTALSLLYPQRDPHARSHRVPRGHAFTTVALVYLMVLTGGLVAGIRAGFAYNTWPLMNGHVVPPELMMIEPWWRNFFWNMATVQLDHRLLAYTLLAVIAALWWRLARNRLAPPRARMGSRWLLLMVIVQAALGISALLLVVPLPLAALHQAGAVLLFALAINVAHAAR